MPLYLPILDQVTINLPRLPNLANEPKIADHALHVEYTWSLVGFIVAATLREVLMDSRWTPDGVHQDPWLSVTSSKIYQKLVIVSKDYLLIFLHVLLCNTYIV